MLSKYYRLALSLILILPFCACSEDDNITFWGTTEYYEDFPLCNYEPVQMTRELVLDFNEDAKEHQEELSFALYEERDERIRAVDTTELVLYKAGKLCPNNQFTLNYQESKAELSIELKNQVEEGTHKYLLCLVEHKGINRINDLVVQEAGRNPAVLQWYVEKNVVTNPLKLGLITFFLLVTAALLLWILIIRQLLYPSFKLRRLTIIYPQEGMKTVRIGGAKRLVLTKEKKKQSFLSKLFFKEVVYQQNPYWTSGDIELTPHRDKGLVRLARTGTYYCSAREAGKGQAIEISKEFNDKEKVRIL